MDSVNLQQSKLIIIGISLAQCYKFAKCIIPYFKDINKPIFQEVKDSLDQKTLANKLNNHLNFETKYYTVGTQVYCYTYNDILEDDEPEQFAENIQKQLGSLDAIYFLTKVKNQKKIEGLDSYQELADIFVNKFKPQLQTVVYDVKDENLINDTLIQKIQDSIENYIEAVYEDIQGISNRDEVTKEKSKSIYEDTDGITRIVEAIESTMWTGYIPKPKQQVGKQDIPEVREYKEVPENQEQDNENKEQENQYQPPQMDQQQNNEELKEQPSSEQKQQNEQKQQQINTEQKEEIKNTKEQEDQQEQQQQKQKQIDEDNNKENQDKQEQKQQQQDSKQKKKKIQTTKDEDGENDLTNFVSILGQMKMVRENNQNLTDDERKKQAANVIMKLMEECQFGDDSEDEEEN